MIVTQYSQSVRDDGVLFPRPAEQIVNSEDSAVPIILMDAGGFPLLKLVTSNDEITVTQIV